MLTLARTQMEIIEGVTASILGMYLFTTRTTMHTKILAGYLLHFLRQLVHLAISTREFTGRMAQQ